VTNRRRRFTAIPLVLLGALVLSACEITATGTGTVTIDSTDPAVGYDTITGIGTVARACETSSPTCRESDPFLYTYYPATGSRQWIVAPGFLVFNRSNELVGLPAGRYTVQAEDYVVFGGDLARSFSNAVIIDVFDSSEKDLSIWHQSYGRDASDAPCQSGWDPGWAQWPDGGSGGYVCNREIYKYYPDEPVKGTGAVSNSPPWFQSVARGRDDADCPDGYLPGWAQWPDDGAGGFVCNRTVR
jgi:hypothetical protein